MNYLLELRDKVDKYKLEGKISFTGEEYEEAKEKYLKLLDIWDTEFKKPMIKREHNIMIVKDV